MQNYKNKLSMAWRLCCYSIAARFGGSLLGGLWVFIWPALQLLMYILIFGRLMGRRMGADGELFSYGIYLAAGLVSWTCFAGTLQKITRAFIDRRNIIGKVAVDLKIFPLAINMEELLPFGICIILLALADMLSGWQPRADNIFLACYALYCQQILATGLGLLIACAAVFYRDLAEMAAIAVQMAFWFTPIVYLPNILPDWLAAVLWLNPMCVIVQIFQNCFVFNGKMDFLLLCWIFFIAHFTLAAGLILLKNWKKDILDAI